MTSARLTRRIGFIGFPLFNALDLTGPMDVFTAAAELELERAGPGRRPVYEAVVIGLDSAPFRAESRLTIVPDTTLADAPPLDTIIVPGGCGVREPATLTALAQWLRGRRARRIASVCTGAYALAEAGLLDGCVVSTHWRHAQALAARYPQLAVDADAIFLRTGHIYTSAGISAGIDLALALVAEDHGPALALQVARELVVHVKRDGGQRQYSAPLAFQTAAGDRLGELAAWMLRHLDGDLSLERLAERCSLSRRQLSRRFREAFGLAPAQYVERLRVDEARQRLVESRTPVDRIASAVGFRSVDVFRRAFARQIGIAPARYRALFRVGEFGNKE
ncbi:MAG: GlxA family transcriptional regulator [Rhodanobacteraceae bacterium]|nr:GlxA family transcriptional regulator [Rhodanobacteraceae bacterium]